MVSESNMQFGENEIALYPTDTLYGLGVDATNPNMVQKLKELKGREEGKHISIAVSNLAMLERYAEVTPLAKKLIEKFLPGKLTLILNVRGPSLEHLGDGETVGVRIPAHEKTLKFIREFGKPITATSANVSGMEPESTPEKILEQFGEKASIITKVIDGGELASSKPSTVVDARGEGPIIIREGAVAKVAIFEAMS